MRGLLSPAASLLGLALGATAGCYHEDFLLGAFCFRDASCGVDNCCNGGRCRPLALCNRGVDDQLPPLPGAYSECAADDDCHALGFPLCLRLDGADTGFCTDLCVSDAAFCESHPDDPVPDNRACLAVDEQQLCAIACADDVACPGPMQCRGDVCVPR
jgi:hypothetical protein